MDWMIVLVAYHRFPAEMLSVGQTTVSQTKSMQPGQLHNQFELKVREMSE